MKGPKIDSVGEDRIHYGDDPWGAVSVCSGGGGSEKVEAELLDGAKMTLSGETEAGSAGTPRDSPGLIETMNGVQRLFPSALLRTLHRIGRPSRLKNPSPKGGILTTGLV